MTQPRLVTIGTDLDGKQTGRYHECTRGGRSEHAILRGGLQGKSDDKGGGSMLYSYPYYSKKDAARRAALLVGLNGRRNHSASAAARLALARGDSRQRSYSTCITELMVWRP